MIIFNRWAQHLRSSPFLLAMGVLAILFSIQYQRATALIPVELLRNDSPLLANRYGQEYAWALRDQALIKSSGRFWGYDPYLMAGYPAGNAMELESHCSIAVARWLRPYFDPAHALKIYTFLTFLIGPMLLFLSAKLWGADLIASLVAAALAISGFAGHDFFSSDLIYAGDHDFIWACYLGIQTISLLHKLLSCRKALYYFLFGFSLAALSFANVWVFLITLIPLFTIYTIEGSQLDRREHFWILAATGGVFILVFRWGSPFFSMGQHTSQLSPVIASAHDFQRQYFLFQGDLQQILRCLLRWIVLGSSLGGLWILKKENKNRGRFWLFLISFFFIFGVAGSRLDFLNDLRPFRFLIVFSMVQIIPAAIFLRKKFFQSFHSWGLVLTWFLLHNMTWDITNSEGLKPLLGDQSSHQRILTAHLQTLPKNGRVLWEDNNLSSRWAEAVPYVTGHFLIGVPRPSQLYHYMATDFIEKSPLAPGILFGRLFSEYGEADLKQAMRRYNIQYIVATSLQSRSRFDRYPYIFRPLPDPPSVSLRKDVHGWPCELQLGESLIEASTHQPVLATTYRIYEFVGGDRSYFLEGSGDINAEMNKIQIMNPSHGQLILKFHWLDGLKGPFQIDLKPVYIPDDPVPFIQITNISNLRELTLRFDPS